VNVNFFISVARLLTVAAMMFAPLTTSQESGEKQAAEMQPPKPAPEMSRLNFLLGKWHGVTVYEKTSLFPQGGKSEGPYVAVAGPGGFSQIADFEATSPMGKEMGHEVISWVPSENAYKRYVFGNTFPGCIVGTGHWEGESLVFVTDFDFSGKTMHLRSVTTANPDGSVKILESGAVGDTPMQLLFTTTAKRV
jgi:hypothetical protein